MFFYAKTSIIGSNWFPARAVPVHAFENLQQELAYSVPSLLHEYSFGSKIGNCSLLKIAYNYHSPYKSW